MAENFDIKQNVSYPHQVASVIQKKNGKSKTLGIDAELSIPRIDSENEKAMPLEMHSGFSRFVATLIEKGDNKSFVKANIPADDISYIYEKTQLALLAYSNAKMQNASSSASEIPACYTAVFGMGKFKGKTPAALLMEDPNNEQELIAQGEFLNKNAEKYPANKTMVAAIKEAIMLHRAGELKPVDNNACQTGIIELYNEQTKPLRSNTDDKGNTFVYGIKIICDISRNLPFSFEITNCYAPVKVMQDGTLRVEMKSAEKIQTISMNLSEKDWVKIISRLNKTLENFEMINFKEQLKKAVVASMKNRQSAQENKEENK